MATQIKVNPNDPRVKRTRQLLKQALTELLTEKPFHDITVQDIADRATVNRVTFYSHFEDKYDLISTWIQDGFVERLEQVVPPTSPLIAENLEALCRVVLEWLRDAHGQCRPLQQRFGPLFESAAQEALYAFILDWLRHGSRAGPSAHMRMESVAAAISWTIFGAGIDWSRNEMGRSVEGFAHEIVAVLMHGVSSVFQDAHSA